MRKTLVLFLAFLTLIFSVYFTVFAATNKEKDNVAITEVFSYGNKTAADKISINLKSLYRKNLLWDTTYNIGKNVADTEFSIYKNRIPREYKEHKDLSLGTSLLYSVSGPHTVNHYTGLDKLYKELIESAEPNIEVKKLFLLSDYLDFYPVNVDVSFPGKYIDLSSRYDIEASDKAFIEGIREFFRIPIMKDHKIELRATVGEDGTVYSSGTTSGSGLSEDEDSYGFYADSVITDKECFIFFGNKSDLGKTVDTSLIPGGYGIYRLPYNSTAQSTTFDAENLKNIYPIKSDYTVCDLDLSKDGKYLYLITCEEGKNVFSIIDAESFETKERTVITEEKDESVYLEYIEKDFLVFNIYHPIRDSKITVFTLDKNGNTHREFTVNNYIEIKDNYASRHIGADIYEHSQIKALWDSGKLYVANPFDNTAERDVRQNGFRLAVFGKDGMEFYGEYITSLSAGNDGYQASSYHIYTSRDDKINIILN